jgi:hypothetical protein
MNSFCEKRERLISSREVMEVSSWELEWIWLSCRELVRLARRAVWEVALS